MENLKDDNGYNQVWADCLATRVRATRRCRYLMSQIACAPSTSLLEIGCGIGTNAYFVAKETGIQVLATDLCGSFIERAQKNNDLPNLHFERVDFHEADRLNQQFDYIIGNGILHHLYSRLDEVLARMLALLRKNGKILFFEPNLANPYVYSIFKYAPLRKWARLEPDEMAFSKAFIFERLSRAGYKDIKVEYKDFLLPGIPEFLIAPSIFFGNALEKVPLLRTLSQSLFISARE